MVTTCFYGRQQSQHWSLREWCGQRPKIPTSSSRISRKPSTVCASYGGRNSIKCVSGVPSGKLLGFIISHRGIETNPEKITAITNMEAPASIKDVQAWRTGTTLLYATEVARQLSLDGGGRRHLRTSSSTCRSHLHSQHQWKARTYCCTSPRLLMVQRWCGASEGRPCIPCVDDRVFRQQSPFWIKVRYPSIQKLLYTILIIFRKLHHYFDKYQISVVT